jgi:hypothetical protein
MDYTNEQVMNLPLDDRPDGWFNPWILTDDEIVKMRQGFKGGALKWSRFVENKLPQLSVKEERILKAIFERDKRVANCGKIGSRLGKDGLPYQFTNKCHQYHICQRCQNERQDEHYQRLLKLDGCQVIFDDRKNMVATYGADVKTYSFKLADGRQVTVIDSDQPVEGAVELNHELAKQLKTIHITGTKISGKLGKEQGPTIEAKEEEKLFVNSYIIEGSNEAQELAKQEFFEQTKDLQPTSVKDLKRILVYLNQLWLEILTKHCTKIHLLNKHFISINENDLDWTKRREYVEQWLRSSKRTILTNREPIRSDFTI